MNTILYTQNKSATQKNTIVVNGEVFHNFDDEIANCAFHYIMKKSEKEERWNWLIKILINKGIIKSTKFKYIKDADGILIRSNFNEKDELGRYMPFLFFTKEKKLSSVNKSLKAYSKLLNRTHDEEEILGLDKAIKITLYGGISIGIILLSIIIWKI